MTFGHDSVLSVLISQLPTGSVRNRRSVTAAVSALQCITVSSSLLLSKACIQEPATFFPSTLYPKLQVHLLSCTRGNKPKKTKKNTQHTFTHINHIRINNRQVCLGVHSIYIHMNTFSYSTSSFCIITHWLVSTTNNYIFPPRQCFKKKKNNYIFLIVSQDLLRNLHTPCYIAHEWASPDT